MWTSTLDAEPLEQWRRIAPEPTSTLIFDVAYGNQNFVIIGARGAIFTSTNGIDWVDRSLGRTNELRDIAYGNGVFTATGVSYGLDDALNGMVWTSADGAQWTGKAIDPIVGDIVFGNGLFAAVSPSSIMTSPDGIAWTPHPVVTPLPVSFRGIIYANGLFVVVGGGGTILTSSDGMTWTPRVSGVAKGLNDVAYGSNLFVVVGDSTILTSPDGIEWTKRQGDGGWDVASVRYVSGQFIAHGYLTLTSPDGVNWTPNPPGQLDHIKEVAYGNKSNKYEIAFAHLI